MLVRTLFARRGFASRQILVARDQWAAGLIIGLCCLFSAGCSDGSATKVIFGRVTCGGEPVPMGKVRFVPIDGTEGPASTGIITDGEYRIEARGGVPVGRHRVEVLARQKTGRKVWGTRGLEPGEVDETVILNPPEYEGENSPLVREIAGNSDGRVDIEIPRNPGGPRPDTAALR